MKYYLFLLLAISSFKFSYANSSTVDSIPSNGSQIIIDDTFSIQLPLVQNYLKSWKSSTLENNIIKRNNLDKNQLAAQEIVTNNVVFQSFAEDSLKKQLLRTEVFGIMPTRKSDLNSSKVINCIEGDCYRVEVYNFALNTTKIGIVSIKEQKLLEYYDFPYAQPDITPELKIIAIEIAKNSRQVQTELGYAPTGKELVMSDTKTSLNKSRCERSKHLCVAPTFVKGNKALWCIVDLTDFKIVGLRWTNVGINLPDKPVTEKLIQNEKVNDCFCKVETPLAKNGWNLKYIITSSDGLRISDVKYKNSPVLISAKLVDWHVSYSNSDGFGYSDAVGCPFFSTAAVVAVEPPKVKDLIENGKIVGFALYQVFSSEGWPNACNYNYQQLYEFYNDGRMRVAVASLGRGCGNNGTYRPVIRLAFAGENNSFYEWKNKKWEQWKNEKWSLQNELTQYSKEGFQYKIKGKKAAFNIIPGKGQFKDGGRGDDAYTYVTKFNNQTDEGENDLITIGPCCNTDYNQGPEKFVNNIPESIENSKLVLWYVPQLKNDDRAGNEYCWANTTIKNGVYTTQTFPCWAGPMIVPSKK
jgi:hypothetical protein